LFVKNSPHLEIFFNTMHTTCDTSC
jgi:hypothetical protein